MDFRVLGSLEVVDRRQPIQIPPGKQRSLLALLLLHRNEPVTTDRLIDELWGDSPPSAAEKNVQVYVSRLRKQLPQDRLLTQGRGYLLRVEESEVDVDRFEGLVTEGRATLAAGQAKRAASILSTALALWRGPPLAEFMYEHFAQDEIRRLEELRVAAEIERVEAELALRRHEQLVPRLQMLVAQHPLQERLRGQLMLALYRAGRQSEALACYREGRDALVEELGIEPSAELKALEQAILRQDADVAAPSSDGAQRAPARPRGRLSRQAAAALAVGVSAAAALLSLELLRGGTRDNAAPSIVPRSVAAIAASDGTVAADLPLGSLPGPVAAGADTVWVGTGGRLLLAVDPRRRRVIRRYGLPAPAHDLAATDGTLWIGNAYDGTLSRLERRVGFAVRPFRPQRRSTGRLALATGFGSLWVGSQDGRIARLDPAGDRLVATIGGVRTPHALAVGEGAVWLVEATRPALVRIDPRRNRVTGTVPLGQLPTAVAVGRGSVWVATSDGRLWRIDPRVNRTRTTVAIGRSTVAIVPTRDAIWVADADGTMRAVDPDTNEITRTLNLRRPISDAAVAEGLLWVSVQ